MKKRDDSAAVVLCRRGATILAVLTMLTVATSASAQTASGYFNGRTIKLPTTGAYSFWDDAGSGNGRIIKVAVSNSSFPSDLLDGWYDRTTVLHDLFVTDERKVVYFEFDADGKYHGYSYYFGSGDGCGYCSDSKVRSTVRAVNGRLKGKVAFSGSPAFDVDFDVPIPDKVWGDALPKDGGDPGRAYLAYHKALEATDVKALEAASDAWLRGLLEKHEKQGDVDEFFDFRWDEKHYRMQTVTIVGGYVRGDHAVVLFDGSSKMFDSLHGEAVVRKEGGAWLVDDELVQIGKR